MTDPTPTRAEVEALIERLMLNSPVITQDHMDASTQIMPQAASMLRTLRERAEAAEAENQRTNQLWEHTSFMLGATLADLTAARRAEAAAWNDAIEAEEECDCCVDGLQADGETPCPYCTKPKVPIADAAEALLEAHKSGAWPVGQGRTLQQVATIIDALHALRRATPTEGEA